MDLKSILEFPEKLQPGLSIDCVIFGFHENTLKVLLIKPVFLEKWTLPGGFIAINESIDDAAANVLKDRTGLNGIFLKQFATFGDLTRSNSSFNKSVLSFYKIPEKTASWFLQRFVSIGYFALVDFHETQPKADLESEIIEWIDVANIPDLILDHKIIVSRALETLRLSLNSMPIGYNLLPEKFTMPDIQKLYETILDRKLDRRNFLRKINATGILNKLEEKKTNVAHKAPNFYSFDKEIYDKILIEGLNMGW